MTANFRKSSPSLLLAFLVVGAASATPLRKGTTESYHLVPSPACANYAREMGFSEPTGKLSLGPDGTYHLDWTLPGSHREDDGLYVKQGSQVTLTFRGLRESFDMAGSAFTFESQHWEADASAKSGFEPVAGTWAVFKDGKLGGSSRLTFDAKGGFKFSMSGAASAWTYRQLEDRIELEWTQVDGDKVEPGTMKKTIPFTEAGQFKIDSYLYRRAS